MLQILRDLCVSAVSHEFPGLNPVQGSGISKGEELRIVNLGIANCKNEGREYWLRNLKFAIPNLQSETPPFWRPA